ncbi:Thiol:disulfide interchange protein DsbA precursor [Serratia entomophila]|uniref:DsbA family protein n=1 Tax=Serratia entomophila TaxID=42906 RepID=UPI0021775535|nr:DsbA family protein [Serratia entomophila]CAI0867459.1 Thiol:disulfide interchange protein DsbA precursor [Serratia entomophila]
MYKRPLLFIGYTLIVIFASSLMTSVYFHKYVMTAPAGESLRFITAEQTENSPLKDINAIVEVFSYACHYCEVNEGNIAELEKNLPVGTRLIRLHLNDAEQSGMAAFAPLFATLTVMGIEARHRPAAYQAIIKDKIDLADKAQLARWLQANGIDEAEYAKAKDSEQVSTMLGYMTAVSSYYQINATPSFIVNRKWLATQDRDFPAFGKQLLSLLQHDKPLEP